MLHTLERSLKTETKYTHLHDKVYHTAFSKIAHKGFALDKVDRSICDYDTVGGKKLQQSDVDSLIYFTRNNNTFGLKVSEKVRNSAYNDLYLEVISILREHKGHYYVDSLGWSNKAACNPASEATPNCLSYICLNKKTNTYKSLFITGYKELKKKLFFNKDAILVNMINKDFINKLVGHIKEKESQKISSFAVKEINKYYDNIIFAKNISGDTGVIYYTIGITINLNKIKALDIKIQETNGSMQNNIKNKI